MFLAVSIKVVSAIFLARGSRNTSNSSLHINEIRSKVNGWIITISMEKESLCTHITRNGCVLILDRRCQVRPRKTTNKRESLLILTVSRTSPMASSNERVVNDLSPPLNALTSLVLVFSSFWSYWSECTV